MVRIVLISDTHERHSEVSVPEGDLLIHAGDYTNMGDEYWSKDFFHWFLKLPHEYKILVAGNHDFGAPCQSEHLGDREYYLYDSEVAINGLRIWGSPWTPKFEEWAFMYRRPTNRWLAIPEGVDIVVTHGPAAGFRDQPFRVRPGVGCVDLRDRLLQVKPKLHVFGHIHGSYGMDIVRVGVDREMVVANASVCNEAYEPVNAPIVLDIEPSCCPKS